MRKRTPLRLTTRGIIVTYVLTLLCGVIIGADGYYLHQHDGHKAVHRGLDRIATAAAYPAFERPSPVPVIPRATPSPRAARSRPLTAPPSPRPTPAAIKPAKPRRVLHTTVTTGGVHDVTMYCGGGTMADGRRVHEGAVATLDRSIPFGTVVHIDGMGSYVVEDRIGHGSEFDIYTSSCSEADRFGRHRLHVRY